jgi:hypothetical protein
MAIPKIKDLILYVNKALTGNDWNSNWQKIITWLTGGSADVKFNSVDTNSVTTSGTITSNGATINGNADISGNLNVGGIISGDGSGLTGVQSVSTIAYTPFTVNKGYIDTTENSATYGQEILMEKDGSYPNIVNFRVPITATTSDGVTFTLEQLDDLNVDNYTDGTYIVCIKKNQQRAELKMGVYRQRLAPTDNSVPNNTLWLDTSTENIQCYEKLNNVWTEKYDGVPIGEVVVAGGEVSSVKTYHYNWNGYNINVQETTTMKQRPVVMIESWYADNINWNSKQEQTDNYEIYSNGLVVQCGRIKWNDGENGQSHTVPLEVSLSKVCSVKVTPYTYNGNTSEGRVVSISSGTVVITGGTTGNHEGVLLWEVKGYK